MKSKLPGLKESFELFNIFSSFSFAFHFDQKSFQQNLAARLLPQINNTKNNVGNKVSQWSVSWSGKEEVQWKASLSLDEDTTISHHDKREIQLLIAICCCLIKAISMALISWTDFVAAYDSFRTKFCNLKIVELLIFFWCEKIFSDSGKRMALVNYFHLFLVALYIELNN